MAFALIRSAARVVREKGLMGALKEAKSSGYLRVLLDGNLANSKLRLDGVTLVGVDKAGNCYYEKMANTQYGRHRWVVYADREYNASSVPPEWHGWLHHITDRTPEQLEALKPSRYGVEHKKNRTGEGEEYIYHAKGHALNPNQCNWKRYEPWSGSK